ncbi:MAG TPA: hypothetical protein VF584_08825 [Longimicrobium sp.]|jgi:hypothetical protein
MNERMAALVLAEGVAARRSAGGEMLLFRSGEPRGRTVAEAIAAGWASVDKEEPRRAPGTPRRENWTLSDTQTAALGRLFREALGATRQSGGVARQGRRV